MSEPSLPSGEDVDIADEAIQDLIKEAETLMQTSDLPLAENNTSSTDTTDIENMSPMPASTSATAPIDTKTSVETGSPIISFQGNFSIDDEDDGVVNNNINDSLSSAAVHKDTNDHPLSADRLSAPSSANNTPPTSGNRTSTSAMSNIFNSSNGMGGMMNMARVSGGAGEAAAAAAVNMDSLTKTTSMFASNLASMASGMAQRGMAQVAAAAAPPQAVHVMGSQQSMMPGQQQQQNMGRAQPWSNGMKNNVFSTATHASKDGTIGGLSTGTNGIVVTQQLDKEQRSRLLQEHVGDLLHGERVIMFLTNLLHVSDTSGLSYVASQQTQHLVSTRSASMWCCVMTYYRLILFSTADKQKKQIEAPVGWDRNCWMTATPPYSSIHLLDIPLASMDRVEKTVYQAAGSSFMGLVIYAKDCGRVIRFTTTSYADTGRAFESLNTYAFPGRRNLGYLFAFESKREEVISSIKIDEKTGEQGPTLLPTPRRFDPSTEYPRLIQKRGITQSPWALWTSINSTYKFSPSYPSVLVGPASLDETKPEALSVIRQCSAFRSEQRLPTMTWCGVGGASIWRSSQPKVGLQGNRSPADELFVRHIIESARGASAMSEPPPIYPRSVLEQLTGDYSASSGSGSGKSDGWLPEPGCGLKILDLRTRSAAMANRTGGYGYHNTSNYSNTTLQFCNIQNIHSVRDSYQKLCTVCNSKSTSDVLWNSLIEDTKWLAHIRTILAASWEAAYWVHVWRMPILVHCSHGWDRTSQVACLAQLFLDPYYRTRHGFSVLIEKDFMSFGHPFHLRCAHGEGRNDVKNNSQSSSNNEGQISPIFIQFLDCVYQVRLGVYRFTAVCELWSVIFLRSFNHGTQLFVKSPLTYIFRLVSGNTVLLTSCHFSTFFFSWSIFIQVLLNLTRSICLRCHFMYTAVALEICYATRSENVNSWLVFDNEHTLFGIISKVSPNASTKITWEARASC